MITYRRGDVLLLPFPFTDLSAAKRRPVVVLSTDAYNAGRADVIVAAITSNVSGRQPGDCPVTDLSAAGLAKPSVVKIVVGTIERSQVLRQLGSLSAGDLDAVAQAVADALGLPAQPPDAQPSGA